MIKKIFLLVAFTAYLLANGLGLNGSLNTFSLPDQFGKMHTVDNKIKTIVVSFEKGTGSDVNRFLNSKEENFLQKHNAIFVANISGMPSLITKLFALPKMKTYKHKILLIIDDDDARFLKKADKITVYKIKDEIIKKIVFLPSDKNLEKVFE